MKVKNSNKVVLIDGCFMGCHGRILVNMIAEANLVRFDALSVYKKYTDIFDIDDVPEEERKETAKTVAEWILTELQSEAAGDAKLSADTGCGTTPYIVREVAGNE